MLYTKINYFTHLLLNSKYRMFINLSIILILYSILYGNKIVFCMNDNPDIVDVPTIAEAKEPHRPSQQMLAIKREIMTYAGSQAHYLERIEKQDQEIAELKRQIDGLHSFYTRQTLHYADQERNHNETIQEYNGFVNDVLDSPYVTNRREILNMFKKLSFVADWSGSDK